MKANSAWRTEEGGLDMRPRTAQEIVLYGRPQCCLCDEAEAVIRRVIPRYDVDFRVVDVTEDPQLEKAFGPMVPVVAIDGRVYFYAKVSEIRLHRILAGKGISKRYRALLDRFPKLFQSSGR